MNVDRNSQLKPTRLQKQVAIQAELAAFSAALPPTRVASRPQNLQLENASTPAGSTQALQARPRNKFRTMETGPSLATITQQDLSEPGVRKKIAGMLVKSVTKPVGTVTAAYSSCPGLGVQEIGAVRK